MIMTGDADKKSLKSRRVCSYFVEAAKEIILDEGVESVTVRKVADRAGYAFSTIYKHYRDLEALLLDVKASMIGDLYAWMTTMAPTPPTSLDDIKNVSRTYAAYFLEHPHVFRFFYSCRPNPEETHTVALPDFALDWQETFRAFVENGALRPEDVPRLSKTLIYALQGLLSLYFAGYGLAAEALFSELDQTVDFLLGGK